MEHSNTSGADIYRQIGKILRARRKQIDQRQADIAITLSLPQSAISKIETGERKIELIEAIKICQAYQLDFSELFSVIDVRN